MADFFETNLIVKMDQNPLIPRSSNVASIDVAPVIGAVFQNANEPTFKKNVAENVDKYVVENQNLRVSSAKVICVRRSLVILCFLLILLNS